MQKFFDNKNYLINPSSNNETLQTIKESLKIEEKKLSEAIYELFLSQEVFKNQIEIFKSQELKLNLLVKNIKESLESNKIIDSTKKELIKSLIEDGFLENNGNTRIETTQQIIKINAETISLLEQRIKTLKWPLEIVTLSKNQKETEASELFKKGKIIEESFESKVEEHRQESKTLTDIRNQEIEKGENYIDRLKKISTEINEYRKNIQSN